MAVDAAAPVALPAVHPPGARGLLALGLMTLALVAGCGGGSGGGGGGANGGANGGATASANPAGASAAAGAEAAGSAAGGASAPASAVAAGAAASAPPVSVTLVRALPRDFQVALDATGTVTAQSVVEVKPQISAQVLQVHVTEGQAVQKGQPLFTLDARVDQANLKKAEAQLLKDEATLADAQRQLARSRDLLARNFISQGAVDTSVANVEAQKATVAADRAAIDAVKAQLSFSRILAPSAGRIGTLSSFAGSAVSPSGPAMLTITQIDPITVAFSVPQRYLPEMLAALGGGRGAGKGAAPGGRGAGPAAAAAGASAPGRGASGPDAGAGAPAAATAASAASAAASGPARVGRPGGGVVLVSLPDSPGAPRQGRLSFVDSAVDAGSGTVKVKAVFDNADRRLWPGAFVTVKMVLASIPDAIVVPQAAIVYGQRGTIVFGADKEMKAVVRPVKVVASAGTEAVVTGLRPGERIVLDGRQNVRPGSTLVERPAEGGRGRGASAPGGAASGASAPGAGLAGGAEPGGGVPGGAGGGGAGGAGAGAGAAAPGASADASAAAAGKGAGASAAAGARAP